MHGHQSMKNAKFTMLMDFSMDGETSMAQHLDLFRPRHAMYARDFLLSWVLYNEIIVSSGQELTVCSQFQVIWV